jgi:hypothetical protein
MWPLVIALSPAILLAGEPVNRYVMRRLRGSAALAGPAVVLRSRPSSVLLTVISNPLWIALTAPGRWAADKFSRARPTRP